jgi:uncharacterized protein YqeY
MTNHTSIQAMNAIVRASLTPSNRQSMLDFIRTTFTGKHEDSMSLRDRLTEDLKLAMKSRDQLRMDVIRMIKAAVLNKEVEQKKDLDDAEMSRVMTTLIKQRRESVEHFEKAQRTDLAAKERQEITIIEGYLPAAPSVQEIEAIVQTVLVETGAGSLQEMGTVMKAVTARLAGRAVDGKQLSDLVRSKLQSS